MGRVIGIDTGGTFTDLVLAGDSPTAVPTVVKVPSTPDDPVRAILAGLEILGGLERGDHVVHGTTVALNALLTGDVARAALVTNEGFADVIELARQDRSDIYALEPVKPAPLIPRARRFEVESRIWPALDGRGFESVRAPSKQALARLRRAIAKSGAESVAIGLLHSYAEPHIEETIARALLPLKVPLTLSARLLAEHREYERFSTAVVNAVLVPLMRRYLAEIGGRLRGARLSLLQSSGGTLPAARAAEEPVRVLFSGPAGGVVGAARAAREAGFTAFVGLDMGGTSTDVAFHATDEPASGRKRVERASERTREPVRVAGHPVAIPALDIHTIGCGGGSLVTVDRGGILHVGPESAGADPGPVAYGRSDVPTITDAHVLLGHVAAGPFLAGRLELRAEAVRRAFAELARRMDTDATDAARAVLDVGRAAMRRALSVMTMQRGQDPARLPLIAFGGAGGLHAAALAGSLGMPGALVPRHPGALSALGMTVATPQVDLEHTVLAPLASVARKRRRTLLAELERRARAALRDADVPARAVRCSATLDLRYRGQSSELRVPEGADPAAAFRRGHVALYGYELAGREIELVCLRVRARAAVPPVRRKSARTRVLPARAVRETRAIFLERGARLRARVIERDALPPGCVFPGPALVEEYSGTTLVPRGWTARVTAHGHLWLTERKSPALP